MAPWRVIDLSLSLWSGSAAPLVWLRSAQWRRLSFSLCFLKEIHLWPPSPAFIGEVWIFKYVGGWHHPRRSNVPLLMKADYNSFDMKLSYLVVGCAAFLRGAEPISASNGGLSASLHPYFKQNMIQSSNQRWPRFNLYPSAVPACERARLWLWLLVVRNLRATVAQMVVWLHL